MRTAQQYNGVAFREGAEILDYVRFFESGEEVDWEFCAADEGDEQGQTAGEKCLSLLFFNHGTEAGNKQHQPNQTDGIQEAIHHF